MDSLLCEPWTAHRMVRLAMGATPTKDLVGTAEDRTGEGVIVAQSRDSLTGGLCQPLEVGAASVRGLALFTKTKVSMNTFVQWIALFFFG